MMRRLCSGEAYDPKEISRLLDYLGDSNYGAKGYYSRDSTCLPGTRIDILDRIITWIRDPEATQRVMCIKGMAGRGKSTIAATVHERWKSEGSSAICCFRRGDMSLVNRLVCALARQLADKGKDVVKRVVLESVRDNQNIAQEPLGDQFKVLLEPLIRLPSTCTPVLLVVDALDECHDANYAEKIIELLETHSSTMPGSVKFLVTSRPEDRIMRAIEFARIEDLDSTKNMNPTDITRLFNDGFSKIRKKHRLAEAWPPGETIETLVGLSQNLFQWAHTSIAFMQERSPEFRLQQLLDRPSELYGLDKLYEQIVSSAKTRMQPGTESLLQRTIGIALVAAEPISLNVVGYFLNGNGIPRHIPRDGVAKYLRDEILADLKSMFVIPECPDDPIQPMHTSVRDFFIDTNRCNDPDLAVNLPLLDYTTAIDCFRMMRRDLRRNICGLTDLTLRNSEIQKLVGQCVPPGLRYCARFWHHHFVRAAQGHQSAERVFQLYTVIGEFGRKRILHWVEVMCLTGATSEVVGIARALEARFQVGTVSKLEILGRLIKSGGLSGINKSQ